MSIMIKEIPINERPRERLINNGPESLSDEELLALILKTGYKDMSAKDLAAYILSIFGGIENLKNIDYHEIKRIKGLGPAKACSIVALAELNRRMNRKIISLTGIKINTPQKVFEFYKNKINSMQEHVYCIYLDSHKKIIKQQLLFIGTVNYSMIHPRDIFKEAYLLNASSIICVHNHPTGDVTPSKNDINITVRLKEIGNLLGIPLIDHIIVGTDKYYSFLENGKI